MTRSTSNYFSYNSKRFKKERSNLHNQNFSSQSSLKYINLEFLPEFINKIGSQFGTKINSSGLIYQVIALFLLTIGLFLAFQSFSQNKNTDSAVFQTKAEMTAVNQNRIWTNNSLIDSNLNKIELNLIPVQAEALEIKPEPEPEPVIKYKEVVIKKGDTLLSISKENKTDLNSLIELNNLSSNTKIKAGNKLLVALK